ncbi:hypothetical protein [Burkholderia anthina]|uniref:hypothetical protein n=1 Tax=Burkholderia anthina TaxID=179879 RepID=UPI0037C1A8FC
MPSFSLTPAVVTTPPQSLRMSDDHTVLRIPLEVKLADGSRFHVPYYVHARIDNPTFGDTFGHPADGTDAYRLLERLVDHYLLTDTEDENLLYVLRQMKTVANEAVDAFFTDVAEGLAARRATKH